MMYTMKLWPVGIRHLLAMSLLLPLAICDGGGGGGGGGGGPAPVITACCSGGTPPGYLKTNDDWDPTSCGDPSTIVYNVCTYALYTDKPIGSIMTICAGQPLPSGWVLDDTLWNPSTCGHPSTIVQNVWRIKRVS